MDLVNKKIAKYADVNRIILNEVTFSQLKLDATDLYEIIANMILDKENLFFYCTQRSSCRTFKDTKKYVKQLIKRKILNFEIDTILKSLKWDDGSIDIYSRKFSGDLGEYLMCIIIEQFDISNVLISKVSLKTSPSMPAFGNDNIFYDYKNNTLFFGEAKFYQDTKMALEEAFNSINEHSKNAIEFSFIKNHTASFIAEDGRELQKIEKKLETVNFSNVKFTSITFIMSDDNYNEEDYINDLQSFTRSNSEKFSYVNESIVVFLPIISKNGFLSYFERKVKTL